MTIARRDGLDALSMRRLADELGVSTMAAYRHVAGKETLVDDVLEEVVSSIPLESVGETWGEQVEALTIRSYAIFLEVPGLADNLHGRALSRPGIARWIDALSAPLIAAGIEYDLRASFAPSVVWLLHGATRLSAEWSETMRALDEVAADGAEAPPSMRSGREDLGDREAEDLLRGSIRLLISGLESRAADHAA